jgi:Hemerythrin HHE cation binding domain
MPQAKTTIQHEAIRQWVEQRGGTPAQVKSTGTAQKPGLLRIDYPGFKGEDTLEPIEWDTFFEAFEANELAFLYQDAPDSRFSKFIARDKMTEDSAEQDGADQEEEDEEAEEEGEEVEAAELDAIDLLESQHRDVELLFEQLREASGKRERKKLFDQLADNLAAHAKIEELLFYPAVCVDQTADQLHEAVNEHFEVKRVMAELMEIDVQDEEFATKLDELEQLVQHHVEEEENKLFVQVREEELVDLEQLATELEEEFAQLMKSHPHEQIPIELDGPAELPG